MNPTPRPFTAQERATVRRRALHLATHAPAELETFARDMLARARALPADNSPQAIAAGMIARATPTTGTPKLHV